MSRKTLVYVASATVATLLLTACNPATPKFAITHAEQRGRLEKNGLRFVIMPDSTTEMAEVDVRYEVGSREDPPGKAGLAHLVEHLMFQQKPDGPDTKPLMHFINQLSTFFNAYTNWDTTHYMIYSRAEQLEAMLKIEAMRMYFGCQTISEEEFLREREVVRNEIRQRGGTAEGQIPQLVMSSVYPKGHAYERMIGGDDMQLSTITLQDACDFMKKYYVPERATVIVAGGIKVDETVKMINHLFGAIEKRPPGDLAVVAPVEISRERKEFELDVERASVHIAWALPAANTPEGEAAQFGIWNAFFRTVSKAQEYDFAYSVSPGILGGQEAPIFLISIELKGMNKLNEALDFVWKGAKSAYRGFDQGSWAQLEEAKNNRKAQFIQSIEPLTARTNLIGDAIQFSKDIDFDSTELYVFHELDKIGKFDGGAVARATKKALDPDRARVIVIKPNKEGLKGDTRSKIVFQTKSHDTREVSEVDPREAKRPLKVAAELKGLANAKRFELSNGMRVVLLPVDAMPLIATQLIFDVGDANTPDNPLLATATAQFLSLPGISLDAREDVYYRTGINVGCESGWDKTYCYSSGVNIYLDVMIKGLERIVKAGEYNQEGIERWQKRMKESLTTESAQQRQEFQRQALVAVYGPDHPYTKTGILTPEGIGKVHRDALVSFRDKHYSAANATLVVAGAFDVVAAEKLIRGTFGGWGKGHKDAPIARDPYQRTGPAFIGVVGKESPQMTVRIAYPAPAGIDGQEAARSVLTEMMNTRMSDIRFKLGATYGTYARRDIRLGPSSYNMGGNVDAPRAGEALKAMRDGVDMLRKGDNFDVDFVRARRKLIQQLLGESTVSVELASRLGTIAEFGLDTNYYNSLLQQVAAVSPAQVRALIASELDPNNEVVVTLADRETLVKAFAGAGITDVKLVEPDYK
jgi:zinc protease